MVYQWKIVPISANQKLDVREEDLLNDGDFRKCETYRGGGGYDKFPAIAKKRLGVDAHEQFVVQLYGCNLDCPYCYVTREGIWGKYKLYSSKKLIEAFINSKQQIFHLMGGAPALYIEHWIEIIGLLPSNFIFHSDLLLTEKIYSKEILNQIGKKNCLYAVDIKGVTPEDYYKSTRTPFREQVFWNNFDNLASSDVNFYITLTAPNQNELSKFLEKISIRYGEQILQDFFSINLINYNALPFVDSVSRGGKHK